MTTLRRVPGWLVMLAVGWILNVRGAGSDLAWQAGPGYRSAALEVAGGGRPGFTLLAPAATGVGITNLLADRTIATNRVYENGSGLALGDVDGDGWCDIYFCGMEGGNALFRNLGGWRFEDITREAGVACPGQYSTGTALADVDGDGDLDLLVNAIGGGTRLFFNDGRARFTEQTGTRLVRRFGATSMALADVDADGDLDLYVTNYRTDTYRDRPPGLKVEARMVGGRIVVTPEDRFLPIMPQGGAVEVLELGERDFLYLNDGSGRFAPVSWTAGSFLDEDGRPLAAPPRDWGLSVLLRDLNQDGAPDIYVCNDFFQSPDRIWINQASRGFRAIDRTAIRSISVSSMAADVADINRDGFDDILVVDMVSRRHRDRQRQRPEMMQGRITVPIEDPEYRPEIPRNTLFLNRGDGTYAEIAQLSGVAATEWSWSPVFLDVDLDGYEDLLVANGNHHDVQDADVIREIDRVRERETPEARLARFPRLHTANLAFRNRGDLTFEEVGEAWGFHLEGVSQGMALADLDRDGDLDVVLNNLNAPAALYRNNSSAPRLAVRLNGLAPNTRGVGARIEVFGGPVRVQAQEMTAGGRYASADDAVRVFAASSGTEPLRLEVTWRSGRRSVIEGVVPDAVYEVDEAGAAASRVPRANDEPFFEDASPRLGHVHGDAPFDDLARQSLLTHRWSRLGPGVAWVESAGAGEGSVDLVVGAGRGGRRAWFRSLGQGGYTRVEAGASERDEAGLVAWMPSRTSTVALVAVSNYEAPAAGPSTVRLHGREAQETLMPGVEVEAAAGPLAMDDVDGDGDLDLFVGGRMAAGRYPEPVSSRVFTNHLGAFVLDSGRSAALERVGLVSGALFADLDGDGRGELVLACHWGPVRVFRGEGGGYREVTREWGLGGHRGWWNGVATGDFDADGRLDLLASNWGRNTPYRAGTGPSPLLQVHYGDFDGDGNVEALEAVWDPDSGRRVPWQSFETVSRALPFLRAAVTTFRAYAEAGVAEVLGPVAGEARVLEVDTLDSTVFLNRGGAFEPVALPVEAQFAPAFGVAVSDFDGDGREDAFLAQNFFGVTGEASRYDAGVGVWLAGDGRGGFSAVPARRSGIRLFGEQRGCAVADFDGDGRPDLAVGQNQGPTRLYRNLRARPGLRVRLEGPEGNPRGVGAVMRLDFGTRLGPARAIHAGSGYGSQDAFTQVLATPDAPVALEVRWPGGATARVPVAAGGREVRVVHP